MTIAHDPAIQAWLDQEDKRTAQMIRKYGTYIQYIGGASAPLRHLGQPRG